MSNNMWTDLTRWEEDNNAVVFLAVDTQELREQMSYWQAFDQNATEDEHYICDIEDVSEKMMIDALKYAYNAVDTSYMGLQDIYDVSYDYLTTTLQARIHDSIKAKRTLWTSDAMTKDKVVATGWDKANYYNSETKQFDELDDFMKPEQQKLF